MFKIVMIAIFLSACYVETSPYPTPPPVIDYSYCGDGLCDSYNGEDAWNCEDCGGPDYYGYCGDGFCDSYYGEDAWNCEEDCYYRY